MHRFNRLLVSDAFNSTMKTTTIKIVLDNKITLTNFIQSLSLTVVFIRPSTALPPQSMILYMLYFLQKPKCNTKS